MRDFFTRATLETRAARTGDLAAWMKPRVRQNRIRILLAASPKSGSTFLTKLLAEASGLKVRDACAAYGRAEQQIYLPKLTCALDNDTLIGHQHLRASEQTIHAVKLFGFRVVVLVRDFADTVISMRDHHLRESVAHPMAFAEERQIASMSREQHLWFVIRMLMPWYFQFYVSWQVANRDPDMSVHWVSYHDLVAAPEKSLGEILQFCGLELPKEKLVEAVHAVGKKETRHNVGTEGRGRAELTAAQLSALQEMANFYPGIDFSKVGLESS